MWGAYARWWWTGSSSYQFVSGYYALSYSEFGQCVTGAWFASWKLSKFTNQTTSVWAPAVKHEPEYHRLPLRQWLTDPAVQKSSHNFTLLCPLPRPVCLSPPYGQNCALINAHSLEIRVSGSAIRAETSDNLLWEPMLHETHTFRKVKMEDSEVLYLWHTILRQ